MAAASCIIAVVREREREVSGRKKTYHSLLVHLLLDVVKERKKERRMLFEAL
jgi:hypothetical protein